MDNIRQWLRSSVEVLIATVLVAVPPYQVVATESYDLVVRDGRVMDPESGLDAVRNVGVKDGKIVRITDAEIAGQETIDATGHVVAPGFIDLQSHGQDPYAIKLLLRDGVTSALDVEFGAYPVEDYYKEREGKWQANFGVSVGHGWVRMNVMDGIEPKGLGLYSGAIKAAALKGASFREPSNATQLKEILDGVDEGLRQGGVGIGLPITSRIGTCSPPSNVLASSLVRMAYRFFMIRALRPGRRLMASQEVIPEVPELTPKCFAWFAKRILCRLWLRLENSLICRLSSLKTWYLT